MYEDMETVLVKTAAQGGISWALLVANALGENPIAGPHHLKCPHCEVEERFEVRPTIFRKLEVNRQYANWLLTIYQCRQCTHMFAPVTGAAIK